MVRWAEVEYMPGDVIPPVMLGFIPPIGDIIILLLLYHGAGRACGVPAPALRTDRQAFCEFLPLKTDFYHSTRWVAETNPVEGNAGRHTGCTPYIPSKLIKTTN
jgi:hypothetical protein